MFHSRISDSDCEIAEGAWKQLKNLNPLIGDATSKIHFNQIEKSEQTFGQLGITVFYASVGWKMAKK